MQDHPPRHSLLVRLTHWLTTIAFLALLVSGLEIVISHPRFYWGETGNVNMQPLFNLHIPSSRDSIPNGYSFSMPDANGWGRSLHFQSAWLLVFTAIIYGLASLRNGHFLRDLIPAHGHRNLRSVWAVISRYLHRAPPDPADSLSYNTLQRLAYLAVIFILVPFIIWTGLALSPTFNAAFPFFVNSLGGRQSARTLHFFDTIALVAFLIVHVIMVARSGFKSRMRAMTIGDSQIPAPTPRLEQNPS